MLGFCLWIRRGVPACTWSPSLTISRGLNPLKSVGFTATTPGDIVLLIWAFASPLRGTLSPLRNRMWFDILFMGCSLTLWLSNYLFDSVLSTIF